MGCAKHVGRVGALAFVLGVGIGLGVSPGVAVADETGGVASSPAGESSPTDTEGGTGAQDTTEADPRDGDGDVDDDAEDADEDAEHDQELEATDPDEGDTPQQSSSGPTATRRNSRTVSDDPVLRHASPTVSAAAHEREARAEAPEPETAAPIDAISLEPAPPPRAVEPIVTRTEIAPTENISATTILTVSAPTPLLPDEPEDSPLTSPTMWVLAAAARRELAANTPPTASLAYLINPTWLTSKAYGDVNGRDADRDPLTYTVSTPPKGTVTINRYGTFTYTPTAAARHNASSATATSADKTDTFSVNVSDGNGGTAIVAITVAIKPINARPTARNTVGRPDAVTGVVTGGVTVVDKDGDAITYSAPAATAKGAIAINTDGTFTYTPSADARDDARSIFRRLDSFKVAIDDGHGGTTTTTVYVRIAPPPTTNVAPVDAAVRVDDPDASGVVTGRITATDYNGDTLTFTAVDTETPRGAVSVAAGGQFTYTPTAEARTAAAAVDAPDEVKSDSFVVTVSDGRGGTLTVPVSVPVSPLPYSGEESATGVIRVPNPSGGALDYDVDDDPALGTASVDDAGVWTYAPTKAARHQAAADDAGNADKVHTFTVTVTDSVGNVTVLPISVGITGFNEVPVVEEESEQQVDAESGVTTGVIVVTDADGDPIDADVDVDPALGTASYDIVTGVWTFEATPEARHAAAAAQANAGGTARLMRGFAAFAAFAAPEDPTVATITFTFRDGYGGVQTATVQAQISPANEDPVVTVLPGSAADPTTGTVTGTITVTDGDDDPLTYTATSAKGVDIVIDSVTGAWSYTPTAALREAAGADDADPADLQDTITFTVDDGHGGIITATVNVPIAPPLEHPRIVGWPAGTLITSATGYGYQLVTNESDGVTTVAVVAPNGVVTVAGSVTGATSFEWDGQPEYVVRPNGGITFLTFEPGGSGPITRMVSVATDGIMNVEVVGSDGRWLHTAGGTSYYLGQVPRDDDDPTIGVWRLAPDGEIYLHSNGYEFGPEERDALLGPDGTIFLAVSQLAPAGPYRQRASLWTISPTGDEAIYALAPPTGSDPTDLSYPTALTLAADGTVYLLATTAAYAGSTLTESRAVLVVEANGTVHRVTIPSVPAGAFDIDAVGNLGVFAWTDLANGWISVVDPSGNMTQFPSDDGFVSFFVGATDRSGAYWQNPDGTILYVSPSGSFSTLDVGAYSGDIIAGPDGAVYLLDTAGGTLITIRSGVVSTALIDPGASFRDGSVEYGSDGTPFFFVTGNDGVRLSVPGVTSATVPFGTGDPQFEVIGDTAFLFGGSQVLALSSDGTTMFTRTLDQSGGELAGPVAFAPDGTVYYTVLEDLGGENYVTHVRAINADGTIEILTVPGLPGSLWNSAANTVAVGSDGTVYVTVLQYEGLETVLTKVYVVPAAM